MELWIKSQDKECLMKVDRLDYDLSNSKHRIMANGYQTLVAEYETKERALEVLDEIQNVLNPMIVFKNCNCTKDTLDKIKEVGACVVSDNSHIEQLSTCVYEMPKE